METRISATGRSDAWRTVNTVIRLSPRVTRGFTPRSVTRTVRIVHTTAARPSSTMTSSAAASR